MALFALAVQLTLAFGHIHAEEIVGKPAAVSALVQSALPQGDPPGHDEHDDKFCDICAALAMLASGQVAMPPDLVVPLVFRATPCRVVSKDLVAASSRAAFRSRAPPLA